MYLSKIISKILFLCHGILYFDYQDFGITFITLFYFANIQNIMDLRTKLHLNLLIAHIKIYKIPHTKNDNNYSCKSKFIIALFTQLPYNDCLKLKI